MSKFKNTLKSKYYWTAKGQGRIYAMLKEQIKERGDSAKLATKIGSTPGYVSQILSGDSEINPTWNKIVKFCLALDKVPILEIKNLDEFIYQENLKDLYQNYEKQFQDSCLQLNTDKINELEAPKHIKLNDFTFLIPNQSKRRGMEEHFNPQYDEYELV